MKKLYVFRFYEEKQFLLEEIEGEGVAGAHPVPPFSTVLYLWLQCFYNNIGMGPQNVQ